MLRWGRRVGVSRLEGRLLDDTGAIVAGARVTFEVDLPATTSDADGRFTIEGIADGHYTVSAELRDLYVSTRIQTGRAIDVFMDRRGLVRVLVRDGDTPIGGAAISLDDQIIATTDESGTAFVLGGSNRRATVTAYGYLPGELSMHENEDPPGVRDVLLKRGEIHDVVQSDVVETATDVGTAQLAVTVCDEHGNPCEAVVFVEGAEELVRCDPSGRGLIRIAPKRRLVYAATEDQASKQFEVTLAADQRTELTLTVEAGRAIAGMVIDSNGARVPDAVVGALHWRKKKDEPFVALPDAFTDSNGRFHLGGLPEGEYSIHAHTGSRWSTSLEARAGDTTLALVVPAWMRVSGVVQFGGVPIQDVAIAQANKILVENLPDGRFELSLERPGALHLIGLRCARHIIPVPVVTQDLVTDLGVIELRRGRDLVGRVLANGEPVANARVTIGRYDHFYPHLRPIELAVRNRFETFTDAAGRFRFAGIAPLAPAAISARHPERGVAPAVFLPRSEQLDLTLLATGAVDGILADRASHTIEVIAERFDLASDVHYARVESDVFVFENLPIGRYRVTDGRSHVVVDVRVGERTTMAL